MKTLMQRILIITLFALAYPTYSQAQSIDWQIDQLDKALRREIEKERNKQGRSKKERRKEREDEKRWEEERERERSRAEERARAEAERIRKEEEFKASKAELLNSLRGNESSSQSGSGYSSGLRGLSSDGNGNNARSSYSIGLRGFSEEHQYEGSKTYSSEFRELSNDGRSNSNQSSYSSGSKDLSSDSQRNGYSSSVSNSNVNTVSSGVYANRQSSSSFINEKPASIKQRTIPTSLRKAGRSNYSSITQYTQYVATVDPEPIYFHSIEANFFRMGSSETQDKSLADYVDAFEQKVDVWKEEGGHEILTFVGDQITSFARATVSNSSVIGAQIMKIVDIYSEAADLKNLHVNIANKGFDAIKRSVATNNPRYIDEALHDIQQKIDQYAEEKIGFKNSAKQTTSNLAGVWTRSRIR